MPYMLTEFDNVTLPQAMSEDNLSTGQVDSALRDSIGGVFDYYQTRTRLPRRQQIPHKGKYTGEMLTRVTSDGETRVTSDGGTRVTAQSVVADLHGKTDDLKAKIGVLGQLWRERMADGLRQWKLCRLLQVKHVEKVENANVVSEVESTFETDDVGWHSEDATTTSVSASDGAPIGLNVQNAGALVVGDAILSIARTSGTITTVQVTGTGIDITWTGSIGDGETLTVDAGAQTVLIGTTDQYSGFVLNASHTVNDWLPLSRGANILLVTVTGGNATVSVEHYNQWP